MNRAAAPCFDLLSGAAAEGAAAKAPACFQRPAWVHAVAALRGRRHTMVAVQARGAVPREAWLFGAVHRRAGVPVFESMPMGGYGGWHSEDPLGVDEERELTARWLRHAPWPVVVLTGAPSRPDALPAPAGRWWPSMLRARLLPRRFETHVLTLGDDESMLKAARASIRSYLRKADRLDFAFDMGRDAQALDRMAAWYRRGSEAWQRPGGTLMPPAFFAALLGLGEVWTAVHAGKEVGAALFLVGRDEVQYQASGSERVKGPLSPMDALLWAASRHYRDRGLTTMNFGASEGLDSVARFKEKFGARATPYLRVTYLLPSLLGSGTLPATGGAA